jgi:hypothetical protein
MIPSFFTVRGVTEPIKAEFKLTCMKRRERIGVVISGLMIDYIASAGYDTNLWKGFKRVRWGEVKQGQEVYLAGVDGGVPEAFGPNTVAGDHVLKNLLGAVFVEPKEILLRRVK